MIFLRMLILWLLALGMMTGAAHAEFKKNKIAVLDFQQNGRFESADVGKMVAEWFTTSLVETGRFDIIERRLLQQLLEEQKIGASGLIDPTSATRLGKVLGVTTVVSGTVQSYDGNYEINARLINVETGSIIVAEKVRASSATRLTDLVSSIAARIIRNFPLQGYVVQRGEGRAMVDLGRQSGVRPGMTFSVYTEGKPIKHPRTGEVLDIQRTEQGVVLIDEVQERTASGAIVKESCDGCVKVGHLVKGLLAEDEQRREALAAAEQEKEARKTYERLEKERSEQARREREQWDKERKEREQKASEQREKELERQAKERAAQARQVLPFKRVAGHTGDVKSVVFSDDGTLAASGDRDKVIIVWDTRNWNRIATLKGHKNDVQALRFHHKGRYLASGDRDETILVWDLARQAQILSIKAGRDVNALDYNPAGTQLASGLNSKEIGIWDAAAGTRLKTLVAGSDVLALSYSPDGRLLATAGKEKTVRLWDLEHGAQAARLLEGHRDDVRALAFSPGGGLLATGSDDKSIILWKVADGSQQKRLVGHEDKVVALAISRDGHRLVSAETRRSGGTIIVWNTNSGQEIKRFHTEQKIESLAMSPDGYSVLVGSDKNLLIYRLD